MVRAAQFAAGRALVRVRSNQGIVRAAVVAARFGYFVLLDSHVSTFVYLGLGAAPGGSFRSRFNRCDVRLGVRLTDVQPKFR